MARNLRSALAIGNPVQSNRRADSQHLLAHDVTLERRTAVASELDRQRQAEKTALATSCREPGVVVHP